MPIEIQNSYWNLVTQKVRISMNEETNQNKKLLPYIIEILKQNGEIQPRDLKKDLKKPTYRTKLIFTLENIVQNDINIFIKNNYIFSLENEYKKYLQNGIVSNELINKLSEFDIQLSKTARVEEVKFHKKKKYYRIKEWKIIDNDKKYIIRAGINRLNIYSKSSSDHAIKLNGEILDVIFHSKSKIPKTFFKKTYIH